MAYGDLGGAVTELTLTCKTPAAGTINIAAGDSVKITGDYTVTNATAPEDAVFGQAMADAAGNGVTLPVRVRGVCVFAYDGTPPVVDGSKGVLASGSAGKVKAPSAGNGNGLAVSVDAANNEVQVLL